MPKPFVLDPALTLEKLSSCHRDFEDSLRLYFSPTAPTYVARFAGELPEEVGRKLELRLSESDARSAFAALTALEARFRTDFDMRCRKRLKDRLSGYFREVEKTRKAWVRLDEDILEGWKRHTNVSAKDISALRGAFNFRHWFAHGRYYPPRFGRKYDFDYVYLMADTIISGFDFLP